MKFLRYFPLILTTAALLSLGSCKQDLGQDPPFDYPDEGSSGVQLPDPLYHLACDDDLFLDGTLAGEMKTFTGESPMFVDGKSGKAYQNVDGQALILTPDAASTTALKSLGNYSIFMWIKFDEALRSGGVPVKEGRFGAHMRVGLVNDGPVTIVIDTEHDMPDGTR